MSKAMIINNRIVYRGIAAPIVNKDTEQFPFHCQCNFEKRNVCCNAKTLDGLVKQFVKCVDDVFDNRTFSANYFDLSIGSSATIAPDTNYVYDSYLPF